MYPPAALVARTRADRSCIGMHRPICSRVHDAPRESAQLLRAGPTRYLAVRHERRARTQAALASAGTRTTGMSASGVDETSKVRSRCQPAWDRPHDGRPPPRKLLRRSSGRASRPQAINDAWRRPHRTAGLCDLAVRVEVLRGLSRSVALVLCPHGSTLDLIQVALGITPALCAFASPSPHGHSVTISTTN